MIGGGVSALDEQTCEHISKTSAWNCISLELYKGTTIQNGNLNAPDVDAFKQTIVNSVYDNVVKNAVYQAHSGNPLR